MSLTDCIAKMPLGRRFKRRISETWLRVYEDGTLRYANKTGKGPKKVATLTVADLAADDWHYECVPKPVTLDDLIEAAKNVAKANQSTRLSPVEVAREIASELELT